MMEHKERLVPKKQYWAMRGMFFLGRLSVHQVHCKHIVHKVRQSEEDIMLDQGLLFPNQIRMTLPKHLNMGGHILRISLGKLLVKVSPSHPAKQVVMANQVETSFVAISRI